MKNLIGPLFCALLILCSSCNTEQTNWVRINQLGYRPDDVKVAVFMSSKPVDITSFSLIDAGSGKNVETFQVTEKAPPLSHFTSCYRLNFSELQSTGSYRIKAGRAVSPEFRIAEDVYDGTADYLLTYMRQQRCGFNPFVDDSCHTHDGYEIYSREGDSARVDVTGGWH
ncbi:MAG TPA: glycoside hydrolase family 9 protein, partial [Bacteroidales bacterium]|nr:glycoside hydrolase family 9 protein [Bacteroidales bacterium]